MKVELSDYFKELGYVAGYLIKDRKRIVILKCPVCNKEFEYEVRNLKFHKNPCCSRRCGGIKSHW